jgi:hypothetical protein
VDTQEQPPQQPQAQTRPEIHQLQPDQLVASFSNSPIVLYGTLALVFHVVLIGALSIPTLMDWAGAGQQTAQQPDEADPALQAPAPDAGQLGEEPDAGSGEKPDSPAEDDQAADPDSIEARKNTKVYKDATTATEQAPENPDEIDPELFQTRGDM